MQAIDYRDERIKKAIGLIYELMMMNGVSDVILVNACVNILANILLAGGASSESVLKIINAVTEAAEQLGGNAAPASDFEEKAQAIRQDASASRKK